MEYTIDLLELIEISEENKAAELILDEAVKNAFGYRKPLTEILDKQKKTHTKSREEQV